MMKWWKINLRRYSDGALADKVYYALDRDATGAIRQYELYGMPLAFPEANEVDPSEVPPVIRGLKEATVDELYDELKRRGWNVSLSK